MKETYRSKSFLAMKEGDKVEEYEARFGTNGCRRSKKYPTVIRIGKSVKNIVPSMLTDSWSLQYVHDIKVDEENKYFCDVDGVLFTKDKTKLIAFPRGRLGDIYCVPEGTLIIGENAFSNSYVTEIKTPASVSVLEKQSFYASYSYLVDLSDSPIKKLGAGCFKECDIYVVRNKTLPRELMYAQNWKGTKFISPDKKEKLCEKIFSGNFHEHSYWNRYE